MPSNDFFWRRYDRLEHGACFNLTDDDVCLFYMDRVNGGYGKSVANQKISNLKADLNAKPQREFYKNQAIEHCAANIAGYFLPYKNTIDVDRYALVPIPPSSIFGDPSYDIRMIKVCNRVSALIGIQTIPCLSSIQSTEPYHISGKPRCVREIKQNTRYTPNMITSEIETVVLIDDVLNSGAHFSACKELLLDHHPGLKVVGMFWAKHKHEPTTSAELDFSIWDDLL